MKKNILNLKHIIFIFAFIIFLLLLNSNNSFAGYQSLNNLDFNAKVNSDGSMNVTETWNIYISETNTLFKTFELNSSKYSSISDVKVKNISGTTPKDLTQVYEEMYHVSDNSYYALKNSSGLFEIAWNVGLDNSSATRTYQISYKVNDVIGKYTDCDELYWQFVGSSFAIDTKKITGKISLPKEVTNLEDLRVWGHTKYLNGEIKKVDNKTVSFQVDNFDSGTYVEVRIAVPANTITSSARTYSTAKLSSILSEETKWADDANARRAAKESGEKIIKFVFIGLAILFTLFLVYRIIKSYKELKRLKAIQFKPDLDIKYFRDLPNKNTSPAEAIFLTSRSFQTFSMFGNLFASIILDLTLKGYLSLEVLNNDSKRKENILIKSLSKDTSNLSSDELMILDFIKASQTEDEITLKSFEKYISNHPSKISKLQSNLHIEVTNLQISKGNFDEENYKKSNGYALHLVLYIMVLFFTFMIPGINILILANIILTIKIMKAINVFSQDAVNEIARWKGLKKYMEDFSLLKEKEVPDLVIWEHFLVYATAFGISDKVIKQLSIVYPNFETSDAFVTGSYMHLVATTNFASTFTNSISSSINTSYSSGSGGGGGFSGGGGGGGRWWTVAADAKI